MDYASDFRINPCVEVEDCAMILDKRNGAFFELLD